MSRKSTGSKFSFHLRSSSEESDPKATHMRRLEQVIYKESIFHHAFKLFSSLAVLLH